MTGPMRKGREGAAVLNRLQALALNHGLRAHAFFKHLFEDHTRHFLGDLTLCDEGDQSGEVIRRDRALLYGKAGFVEEFE